MAGSGSEKSRKGTSRQVGQNMIFRSELDVKSKWQQAFGNAFEAQDGTCFALHEYDEVAARKTLILEHHLSAGSTRGAWAVHTHLYAFGPDGDGSQLAALALAACIKECCALGA